MLPIDDVIAHCALYKTGKSLHTVLIGHGYHNRVGTAGHSEHELVTSSTYLID